MCAASEVTERVQKNVAIEEGGEFAQGTSLGPICPLVLQDKRWDVENEARKINGKEKPWELALDISGVNNLSENLQIFQNLQIIF